MSTYLQFGQVPFNFVTGLGISNNATTPNTKLNVATGSILDSTGTFQLTLSSAVIIDATTTGLNGLDTGALAASTVYAVHVIADPITGQETGCMLSTSTTAPLMPFGYSAFALIGYVVTSAGSVFLKGLWSAGSYGGPRVFMYDAPQATAITAGADTSYTAIDLSAIVPATSTQRGVYINSAFTPGAASRTLKLQPTGNTGDAITITGQVTAVIVTTQSYLFARISSSLPKISYVVANAGDAAAINVAGYDFFV